MSVAMKKVTVLRTVLVADGTPYGRQIVAGTSDEVPADLFGGLEAEGYVSGGKAKKAEGKHVSKFAGMTRVELETAAAAADIDITDVATDSEIIALLDAVPVPAT